MEDNILHFYRRLIFGTNYDITNPTNIDMICNCCFIIAWKDMARTYKNEDSEKRKKLKIVHLKEILLLIYLFLS